MSAKAKTAKKALRNQEKILPKAYLIPSIIAIGVIPLIVHEHTYNTHLENEEWFASGNEQAVDFFLFYKQWFVVFSALACLVLLLIRVKHDHEKLPWEKKAFIPLIIYAVFVFMSACFAKKPLFAFAGGYDMFQSALAILSYLVIFYYTYSCIKSEEHVLYLLRGAEVFILIELLICLLQVIGHDPIGTDIGKHLITNPSRWSQLDTLSLTPSMYGTVYNPDYLAMYLPELIPIIAALIIVEQKLWRRIFNGALLVLALFVTVKASSSAVLAIAGAVVIGIVIISSRKKKSLIICLVILAALVACAFGVAFKGPEGVRTRIQNAVVSADYPEDSSVPIKKITTGSAEQGVTIELKDGRTVGFQFAFVDNTTLQMNAWDKNGNPLQLVETDPTTQTFLFTDGTYSVDMHFQADQSRGIPSLQFVISDHSYYFVYTAEGYYMISTAARLVKMPQKQISVCHIFKNGYLSGRGPIYNRSLPLLGKYIIVGSGADNYIMAYPQRDYIIDGYIYGGANLINVKPHSWYLQMWIQEGFIAFAMMMIFLFWYIIRSIGLYRKTNVRNRTSVMGFATLVGVIAYMIAVLANDSTICTAPVFWVVLGLGCGINTMVNTTKKTDEE